MNFLYQFQVHLVLERVILVNPTSVLEGHWGILSCARLCIPPCKSLFHHKDRRQCILSNKEFDEDDSSLETADGWSYFIKTWSSSPCAEIQYREVASVGMCLKFVTSRANYFEGSSLCETQPGGRVVNLDTRAKIAAVETLHRELNSGHSFYIGLRREQRGDFQWTGGSPVSDVNWAHGQPSGHLNDCCVSSAGWLNYKWDDLFCSDKGFIICEVVF